MGCGVFAVRAQERAAKAATAVRCLSQAAELAPVFGLAGTLISLSKLPAHGVDKGAYMAAIAMAVHATLYGLIAANLLIAPIYRLIERRTDKIKRQRAEIADWLCNELAPAIPGRHHPIHAVHEGGGDAAALPPMPASYERHGR
jgi:chemotaxis protein MotA